jgi:hypothetical protein
METAEIGNVYRQRVQLWTASRDEFERFMREREDLLDEEWHAIKLRSSLVSRRVSGDPDSLGAPAPPMPQRISMAAHQSGVD